MLLLHIRIGSYFWKLLSIYRIPILSISQHTLVQTLPIIIGIIFSFIIYIGVVESLVFLMRRCELINRFYLLLDFDYLVIWSQISFVPLVHINELFVGNVQWLQEHRICVSSQTMVRWFNIFTQITIGLKLAIDLFAFFNPHLWKLFIKSSSLFRIWALVITGGILYLWNDAVVVLICLIIVCIKNILGLDIVIHNLKWTFGIHINKIRSKIKYKFKLIN